MAKKKNQKLFDASDIEEINSLLSPIMEEVPNMSLARALTYKVEIKCKNNKQKEFLKNLKCNKYQICIASGSAGSGKSYISLAYALQELKNMESQYSRIVIIVPTCPAGNMDIGLLKGSFEEKIAPYLQADTATMEKILKNSGNQFPKDMISKIINSDYIDYEIVNFSRGKTFDDSIILINEAENYSKEEMLLLLTRIGYNTKIIISGDPLQKDRKDLKKNTDGLTYAIEKLKDFEEVSITTFTNEDIVRNPLISKILEVWN